MNHARMTDFLFFTDLKNSSSKKIEAFESRANDMILVMVLVFPNGNPTTNPVLDYSSVDYPIQNHDDFY